MKTVMVIAAVMLVLGMALIWIVSIPRAPQPAVLGPTVATPTTAPSPDRAARRRELQDRFTRTSRRLDSLERDTLYRVGRSPVYSRLLREARTRRDHTQYALDLFGYSDTTDPTAWEVARARAQDSLDSLDRFLRVAQAETLQPEAPGPPPSPALQEAARSDSH